MTIPIPAPPTLDPRIEPLFEEVILAPAGYEYVYDMNKQFIFACYGSDSWRLQLLNKESGVIKAFFISGNFIRQMAKALEATRVAMEKAVCEDLGEMEVSPVKQ